MRLNPGMVSAQMQLGKSLMKQEKYPESLSVLQELLRKKSNLAIAHRLLGDVYVRQGHHREALEEYEATILHAPRLVENNPELATIRDSGADEKSKAEAYREAFSKLGEGMPKKRRRKGPAPKRRVKRNA